MTSTEKHLEESLRSCLRTIPLYEIGAGKVIADLGEQAIEQFTLETQKLFVVLSLPSELSKHANTIEKRVQEAMNSLLAGRSLALVLTSNTQKTSEHTNRRRPPTPTKRKGGIAKVKTILGVASGKGGVGKSTLAVNISIALAQITKTNGENLKVGLLDADLYGPSLVRMLALNKPPQRNEQGLLITEKRFGISALSMGSMMKEGQALVWRGPLIGRAVKQLLEGTQWGELDLLLLDLPPGTGDLPLTLAQSASLDAALLVSTPQQVALYDVRKSHSMFNKLQIPVLGMIENMSLFQCPHCGKSSTIFGSGGCEDEAQATKTPFLGRLPISQDLQESADKAKPIMAIEKQRNTSFTKHYELTATAKENRNKDNNNITITEKARTLHLQQMRKNIRGIASNLMLEINARAL